MPSKIMRQIRESMTAPLVRENDSCRASFLFKPDFIGFGGHFPDNPVLPAVVQFSLALFLARQIREKDLEPIRVKKAKFSSVLAADMPIRVCVSVENDADPDLTVACRISGPEETASSFKMDLKRISE